MIASSHGQQSVQESAVGPEFGGGADEAHSSLFQDIAAVGEVQGEFHPGWASGIVRPSAFSSVNLRPERFDDDEDGESLGRLVEPRARDRQRLLTGISVRFLPGRALSTPAPSIIQLKIAQRSVSRMLSSIGSSASDDGIDFDTRRERLAASSDEP